jgi:hypothetical protein
LGEKKTTDVTTVACGLDKREISKPMGTSIVVIDSPRFRINRTSITRQHPNPAYVLKEEVTNNTQIVLPLDEEGLLEPIFLYIEIP